MPIEIILFIVTAIVIVFAMIIIFLVCYKKCPSDRIMVIYGSIGKNSDGTSRTARCIHGGTAFILPIVQAYALLDLTPIKITVELRNAIGDMDIRSTAEGAFTVGISTEPEIMQNAAERLLGLQQSQIKDLATDIILGQLRLALSEAGVEEINANHDNRDKFIGSIAQTIETELNLLGIRLINMNIPIVSLIRMMETQAGVGEKVL